MSPFVWQVWCLAFGDSDPGTIIFGTGPDAVHWHHVVWRFWWRGRAPSAESER